MRLTTSAGEQTRVVELDRNSERWRIMLDGQSVEANVVEVAPNVISVLLGGHAFEFHITQSSDGLLKLQTGSQEVSAEVADPRAWRGRRHGPLEAQGRQQVVAPMPGKVIRVLVNVGDKVEAGQGLLVVEAMKMQNEIRSPKRGIVERILAAEGQPVNAGEILAWVE